MRTLVVTFGILLLLLTLLSAFGGSLATKESFMLGPPGMPEITGEKREKFANKYNAPVKVGKAVEPIGPSTKPVTTAHAKPVVPVKPVVVSTTTKTNPVVVSTTTTTNPVVLSTKSALPIPTKTAAPVKLPVPAPLTNKHTEHFYYYGMGSTPDLANDYDLVYDGDTQTTLPGVSQTSVPMAGADIEPFEDGDMSFARVS